MVVIIGFVTMTALVLVLAHGMARESEAEKRRVNRLTLTELHEPLKKAA
ncbi:hypothetical protein W02_20360 [Nitrospira sp. KM1]|nr:hypothetical protein [Nitrospira sp. KM1]BCA54896.1 hypothetical protein W02_20360 [Nitrospira sp. KM1]